MSKLLTPDRTQQDVATLLDAGWLALPAAYRMPERAPTLAEAQAYCRQLAESHYENFHVASWFLPARLRPHFHSIYAYCRISDDLGDEVGDKEQSLALLSFWRDQLNACYRGEARHPVFVALRATIEACEIPKQPFANLLTAFEQDQRVTRFETMAEVLDYCKYSANPVGHLVLYVCGYRDAERFLLSDHTCTALQLANFWQDVIVDWDKDRVYFPLEDMRRFSVSESDIRSRAFSPGFRELMKHEVAYTRDLFTKGLPLVGMVDRELALDLELFSRGGLEILRAIEKQNYNVLRRRPAITKARKVVLLLRAITGKAAGGLLSSGKAN